MTLCDVYKYIYVISTYILSLGSTVLDNILTIVMMYALVHVYGNSMLCVLSLELDLDTVTFFFTNVRTNKRKFTQNIF